MIENWFATPIYNKVLSRVEMESVQLSIGKIIEHLDFQKVPGWGSHNHSVSDPTFSENLFDLYDLSGVEQVIVRSVNEYINSFDYDKSFDITIKESWLTDTNKGEYTVPHNHGGFDISGVYYFLTNSNDGDINFVNPSPVLQTSKFISNSQYIKYKPKAGKLLLFPSWLTHFVNENETDNRRISLSFNIELKEA